MAHPELERPAEDGAVLIRRRVAAEALPQTDRQRREHQSAAPGSPVDHPVESSLWP